MSTPDILAWLVLNQAPDIKPALLHRLLKRYAPDDLLQLPSHHLQALGLSQTAISALREPNQHWLDCAQRWLSAGEQHSVLTLHDDDYPEPLRQIAQAPPLLFGLGNRALLNRCQLAIVGSRNPTVQGKAHASEFATELVRRGWVVTSGLAIGIDAAAHQGALAYGDSTIAVLGCGIDHIYPQRNLNLAERILQQQGMILSEFAPGIKPLAQYFPRRNRIISGLSKGVLVVEAALKSGSLITARYALEQGREVFAIPGSIHSPMVKGCHYLIQQGAKLVESVDDILAELPSVGLAIAEKPEKSNIQRLATDSLLDSVDYEVTTIDVVAERSALSIEQVTATLLEYELRGLVASVPGGYVKLRG